MIYPRTEGWARWLDREDVLVVDTETTGRGRDAEALSVAVIDTTGRTRFSEPVMPAGPVPAEATAVHGLTRAKLRAAGARGWPEHHGRVARLMAGAAEVLAYNAAFDRRLLRQTAALYELSLPQARWSCVMLAYAAGGAALAGCRRGSRGGAGCRGARRPGRRPHYAGSDPGRGSPGGRRRGSAGRFREAFSARGPAPTLVLAGSRGRTSRAAGLAARLRVVGQLMVRAVSRDRGGEPARLHLDRAG